MGVKNHHFIRWGMKQLHQDDFMRVAEHKSYHHSLRKAKEQKV